MPSAHGPAILVIIAPCAKHIDIKHFDNAHALLPPPKFPSLTQQGPGKQPNGWLRLRVTVDPFAPYVELTRCGPSLPVRRHHVSLFR